MSAYDIYFDISDVDLNLAVASPVSITNITSLAFPASPFFDPQNPAGNGRDFGVSDVSLGTALPTAGGLELFSFVAVFEPTAKPGGETFTISINPAALGFGLRLDTGPVTDFGSASFVDSTVAVGVPEPSSLSLVMLVAVASLLVRRHRWRQLLA